MRRALAVAILTLAATACVAPPRVVNQPLGPRIPDVYDEATATVYIDPETVAEWEAEVPGSGQWIRTHAVGHHYTLKLGLNYGPGLAGQETGADCYATVMLNRDPPRHWPTTDGYGQCTTTEQQTMRAALHSIGIPTPTPQRAPVPRTTATTPTPIP